MKYTSTDKLYFETGPDNQPTLYVDPGEEIEIQTQINIDIKNHCKYKQ